MGREWPLQPRFEPTSPGLLSYVLLGSLGARFGDSSSVHVTNLEADDAGTTSVTDRVE